MDNVQRQAGSQQSRSRLYATLRAIFSALGTVLTLYAGIMVIPLLVSIFYRDKAAGIEISDETHWRVIWAFIRAIVLTGAAGLIMRLLARGMRTSELTIRDGFVVVAISWIILAFFGSLPFYWSGIDVFRSFTNSYFETISGLTTCGSSVITNIEALPNGLLFWRSFTHWLGGVGIIVLVVAILPALGIGGYNLYRAETPGPTKERLSPRIAETAKILWGVYLLLTLVMTLLLWPKMSLFDALCQTFGALSTGGFSTKNLSIAGFDSLYVEVVVIVFMYLGGITFTLHYQILKGDFRSIWKEKQAIFLTILLLVSIGLTTITIYVIPPKEPADSSQQFEVEHVAAEQAKLKTLPGALRYASFQVVSVGSTCGYATADFDLWPNFARLLLILLMFTGANAGSTSGSLKTVRIILLFKFAKREIKKMVQRRAVLPIKYAGETVPDEVVNNVLSFFVLYISVFAFATLLMLWFVPDIITAFTAVAATMGCVGPGLAMVGPMRNYELVADAGKWILSACMLLGRLEIYSILIILMPGTWRR